MKINREYVSLEVLARVFFVTGVIVIGIGIINTFRTYSLYQEIFANSPMPAGFGVDLFTVIGSGILVIVSGLSVVALGVVLQVLRELIFNSRWQAQMTEEISRGGIEQNEWLKKIYHDSLKQTEWLNIIASNQQKALSSKPNDKSDI